MCNYYYYHYFLIFSEIIAKTLLMGGIKRWDENLRDQKS
jgi:hypothetical protein